MNPVLDGITVFIDRDGTLNDDTGYITSPEGLVLYPGVIESVAGLKAAGACLALITNQSAIGRGWMTVNTLQCIHDRLNTLLQSGGGGLDGIFFCPHHPADGCECRKPNAGLIRQAEDSLGVSVSHSYVIGDKRLDMELAQNVGSIGVLVATNSNSEEAIAANKRGQLKIEHITESFSHAVEWILQDAPQRDWSSATQ